MKSRLSLAIVLLVMSVYSWAQILGMYAPAGPSAPDDPIQEYTLSLKATPTDGGSFNTTHVSMAGGKTYNLRAYPSTDFVFVAWLCNGDTLSKSSSYTYTMPYQDVEITGVFAYNPSSPSDPDVATPKYMLTLKATPSDGGSFNTTSTKVSVGERYNLRAYPKTDFAFVAWLCGGDTLSKSASYDYTMPSHNVDITGVFVYCPSNPSDPQDPVLKYQLSLKAEPMNSGSFNISNERLAVGSGHSLRAYANTDFVFKHWMAGDSVLSTSPSMDFVMPSHNVQLVGVFEYNPASPANPNRNHWNKQTGEVIVDDFTSGQLSGAISSAIGGSNSSDVQMMVVAGRITGNDFGIANNYTNCSLLDLSRVTGVTEVPSYAFDYTNLENVYLPATIEKIGRRAFADCSRLSALTVYAMTPPTLEDDVFQGVSEGLVVYVPAASIAQYQDADGWKDFTLLPIQEDIRSISVSLLSGANAADYARMWLELTNTKSGQRMHYVMTDRTSYTFANIIRNTSWNVVLRNERGDVFGQIDKVEVKDEDVSVAFASLAKPQDVSLTVVTPDGKDVTEQTQVTWTDKVGNYLAQAYSLKGLLPETELAYRVTLSQELAMQYAAPASAEYMVSASGNEVKCRLEAIKQVQLTGKVKDVTTQSALGGATVSASQTFGGKYSKTVSTKTDANGNYTLTVSNVPTSLAIAASDYISQNVVCDTLMTGVETVAVPEVSLKSITGAVISLGFTYTSSVAADGEADTQNWYSDYNNVAYTIYNKTKQQNINQFNVQYPQIVLLEEVGEGDVLELTAASKTSAFMPVTATATVDAEQRARATFDIVELGKIQATFAKNGNAAVVGSLYDANGKLLKSYDYSNASLTISNLADGKYTLVSMGSSRLFNTIYNLSQLPQTGLVSGSDYAQNTVEVKSGIVSVVNIDEVPTLDESKLYYTGDNTSFTVNKSSIVAGNYLTLTGHLDFKPTYATSVSNVNLIVDLPESCSFVENSVMVGNGTSSYTLNGTRLTIPVARYTDRVRFCVIPTRGGEYAPSAFAQFDLNGETMTQPIGSANYTAKDLSISVPPTVAKTTLPVSGTAVGKCDIEIYDNEVLIGQTASLANGTWATTCELNEPYNLSQHQIRAKVTTKNGIELTSEGVSCMYDKNAIQVSVVKMYHDNPEMHKTFELTFDFLNPSNKGENYIYYIYNKKFTFTIDFTNNDTTKISDVVLYVKTAKSGWHPLEATYDAKQNLWVASGEFGNMYDGDLPVNVSLDYFTNTDVELDTTNLARIADEYYDIQADSETTPIIGSVKAELEKGVIDYDPIDENLLQLDSLLSDGDTDIELTDLEQAYSDSLSTAKSEDEFFFIWKTYIEKKSPPYCPGPTNVPFEEWAAPTDRPKQNNMVYELEANNPSGLKIEYIKNSNDENPSQGDKWRVYVSETGEFNTSNTPDSETHTLLSGDLVNEMTGDVIRVHWGDAVRQPDNTINSFREFGNQLCDYISQFGNPADMSFKTVEAWLKEADNYYVRQNKMLSDVCRRTRKLPGQERAIKLMYDERLSNYEHRINARKWGQRVKRTGSILGGIGTAVQTHRSLTDGFGSYDEWTGLIGDMYMLCEHDEAARFEQMALEFQKQDMKRNVGVGIANGAVAVIGAAGVIGAPETLGTSLLFTLGAGIAGWGVDVVGNQFKKKNAENMRKMLDLMKKSPKCDTPDPDDDKKHNGGKHPSNNPDKEFGIDPSGYVYEAVAANRLEGVTATCYYKETVEDMYGDLHENIVKWDAAEYAQENPLFTDENGMYRWDVPQGLWQVKFEKDGYETTYSEWLPVPPPQLEVNIAMKQNVQPNVKNARAFEDAVEIEFDKYMMPELLTAENITVRADGKNVEGSITLLNEEVSHEGATETFASKVRFNAAKPFDATEVTVTVSNRVKSYAGIRMQDNFSQSFTIEQEVRKIVCDSVAVIGYGDEGILTVTVLPASAAAGKVLKVRTSSSLILAAGATSVVLDEKGRAEIRVAGELPGAAAVTFTVDGYDLSGTTVVNVKQKEEMTVATPTASIASGTTVAKGTEVTLSCATEGATIYYTLDGSCPCVDTDARKVYDGTPIVVNERVTIKAMAVAPGMYESEVAEFSYTVAVTGVEEVTVDGNIEISPLPVRDKLNVTAGGEVIRQVDVVSTNGVRVAASTRAATKITLDVSRIPTGVYIIHVATDKGSFSRKVVKVQ